MPELFLYLADSKWFPDFVASSEPDAPPPGKVLQRLLPSMSLTQALACILTAWHMCWQDIYYTAVFLRRATFTSISSFTFKPYPNSHMGRGLQLVTAEAHGAKWCFATSHLESPMWSECVPQSSLSIASVRSTILTWFWWAAGTNMCSTESGRSRLSRRGASHSLAKLCATVKKSHGVQSKQFTASF